MASFVLKYSQDLDKQVPHPLQKIPQIRPFKEYTQPPSATHLVCGTRGLSVLSV